MKLYLILYFVTFATCLIRVHSPQEDYSEANLDLYPRAFEVTAPLIIANPFDGCEPYVNADKIKGKIVVVLEAGRCFPQEKTKIIAELGGVGAILAGLRGSLGIYYNWSPPGNESIQLPALSTSYVDFIDVLERVVAQENVTVTIKDTTKNPWLTLGHSAIGILFQIYFQIIAFCTFVIAVYKLFVYTFHKGINLNVAPVSLMLEIMSTVLRIVMMARPLSFYKFGYSVTAEAFFVGYSYDLSFTTDLLITFYWQEILVQSNQQSSSRILNNLKKFRIPFLIATVVVWTLDTVATLSRLHVIRTFENAMLFTASVNTIFIGILAIFFVYTGRKILTQLKQVSTESGSRKVSRLMKIIIVLGILLMCQITATILNMTPFTNINIYVHLFVYWLYWTGLFGASLAKVLMFELPTSPKEFDNEKRSVEPSTSSSKSLGGTEIEMAEEEQYYEESQM